MSLEVVHNLSWLLHYLVSCPQLMLLTTMLCHVWTWTSTGSHDKAITLTSSTEVDTQIATLPDTIQEPPMANETKGTGGISEEPPNDPTTGEKCDGTTGDGTTGTTQEKLEDGTGDKPEPNGTTGEKPDGTTGTRQEKLEDGTTGDKPDGTIGEKLEDGTTREKLEGISKDDQDAGAAGVEEQETKDEEQHGNWWKNQTPWSWEEWTDYGAWGYSNWSGDYWKGDCRRGQSFDSQMSDLTSLDWVDKTWARADTQDLEGDKDRHLKAHGSWHDQPMTFHAKNCAMRLDRRKQSSHHQPQNRRQGHVSLSAC